MPIRPDQVATRLQKADRVWIVAGEESLLIEETADEVRAGLRSAGFGQRQCMAVDAQFDWSGLTQECASPSLFAEQRLIELRLSTGLDAKTASALQAAVDAGGSDIALLVITGALDSRARKTKWFAALDASAALVYAWRVAPEAYPTWIRQRLKSRGLSADAEAVAAIAACTEGHLLATSQIIEQLRALCAGGDQRLDAAMVMALGADMARFDPFGLMDRVFAGDASGGLRAARGLRRAGTELPAITGGLAYVVRQWALAQREFARTGDARAAARSARMFGPRADQLGPALQRTRLGTVQGLLRWLSQIDSASKRGDASAAWDDLLTWTAVASGSITPDFLPRSL